MTVEPANPQINSKYDNLTASSLVAATIYKDLIEDDCGPQCEKKSEAKGDAEEDFTDRFRIAFCIVYVSTNIPKLRSFQYTPLHRDLVLNPHLYRWGLADHNLCTFCGKKKETIEHLLYECKISMKIWGKV